MVLKAENTSVLLCKVIKLFHVEHFNAKNFSHYIFLFIFILYFSTQTVKFRNKQCKIVSFIAIQFSLKTGLFMLICSQGKDDFNVCHNF